MARRVNTAFVAALGGSLGLVAVLAVGVALYRRHRSHDPVVLQAAGDAAIARGDMKEAINDYRGAAEATSRSHKIGADNLYAKMAKLSMDYSQSAPTEEDAVVYYQTAMAAYERASTENPRNDAVNEILLEQQYQRALYFSTAASWSQLEEVAKRVVNAQKAGNETVKPHLYLAVAKMRQVQAAASGDVSMDRYAGVEAEVDKVLKLDPASGLATSLKAERDWAASRMKANKNVMVTMQGLASDAEYAKSTTALADSLSDFMAAHGMSKDVVGIWTQIMLEKYSLTGKDDPHHKEILDNVLELLEKAAAENPNDTGMMQMLGRMYLVTGSPEKAEKLFKDFVARQPQNPEGYFIVAAYYRGANRTKDAITAYKDVIAHTKVTGGLDSIRFASFEMEAIEGVAALNMDLAEAAPAGAKEVQDYSAEAAAYTDKLRTSHAPQGLIDLLDGRAQLIARNLAQATTILHRAEAALNHASGLGDRLRQTKILLARANQLQNQPGAALNYYNEALQLDPSNVGVRLQLADLLSQLARYADAKKALEDLLKYQDQLSPAGKTTANRLLADVEAHLGNTASAQSILRGVGATLQLAQTDLQAGEFESALTEAMALLEKEATNKDSDNLGAYQVAVLANVQLNRKEVALKLLNQALARYPQNTLFQIMQGQLANPNAKADDIQLQVLNAIPDEYVKQTSLAQFYHQQNKTDEEIKALQAAEKSLGDATNPSDHDRLITMIDRLFSVTLAAAENNPGANGENYWKLAEGYMQRAERMNLDGVNGKLYRGRFTLSQSKGQKGLDLIEQAVAQRSDFAVGHLFLGQAFYNLGNFPAALEEFRQVIRLAPNNLTALQMAIELLVRKSDSASLIEAQGLLQGALQLAPRNTRFIEYSDILAIKPEELDLAIRRREAIASQNPGDMGNARRLASLYVRAKHPDKAVDLIKPAYEKDPKNFDTALLMAVMYEENRQVDEGLKIFEPFVTSSDAKQKYDALLSLGEYCKRANLIERAVTSLNEAAQIEPADQDQAERHLGDLYFDQNDMANAEKTYQTILDKKNTTQSRDRLVRRVIETQLRQGKYDSEDKDTHFQHNKLLDELLARFPDDAQALVLRAFSAIEQHSQPTMQVDPKKASETCPVDVLLSKALADLDKVLKNDPDNVDARYFRALAQSSLGGDMEAAIRDLMAVRVRDRSNINARLLLARLYQQSSGNGDAPRYGEAAIEYGDLIGLHPEVPQIRMEYANFLLQLATVQKRQPADSDAEVIVVIRRLNPADKLFNLVQDGQHLFPADPFWPFIYSQLLELQGDLEHSQTFYARLYEVLPDDAKIGDAYLGSLLKTKKYDDVVKLATDLIARKPQIMEFRLKRAAAYQALHQEDKAGEDIDVAFAMATEAATKARDFAPFVMALTQSTVVLSPDKLVERLEGLHKAKPDDTVISVGYMHALMLANRAEDGAKVADSIKLPADDKVMRSIVLRESALVRYQAKLYETASRNYTEFLALVPGDVESLNNYAFMLANDMKKPKEAIPYAERALKALNAHSDINTIASSSANIYDTLGWAKFLAGDDDGAIKALRNSLSIEPSSAAYLHLAQAHKKAKRTAEARKALNDGIKWASTAKDGKDPELEALKRELLSL